jgi:hypothetical protein
MIVNKRVTSTAGLQMIPVVPAGLKLLKTRKKIDKQGTVVLIKVCTRLPKGKTYAKRLPGNVPGGVRRALARGTSGRWLQPQGAK